MGRLNGFVAVLALAGCATQQPPQYIHICPVVPTYSTQFQQRAGDELALLPPDSPITKMVEDYLAVRAEAKACK